MQFAASNHNVKSVFLYKNFKVIKQTILNVITNKDIIHLIRTVKKDNDSKRQTVAFMAL